jgi:hypothetical protein
MPVHLLVVQPDEAKNLGLGETRLGESNLRPAVRLLGAPDRSRSRSTNTAPGKCPAR